MTSAIDIVQPTLIAALAIILHVVNYNVTAQVEHATRVFTKLIGKNAIYCYAAYLVASAILRDYFISQAMKADMNSIRILPDGAAKALGSVLLFAGGALNLWTLKVLGIKNMYNGDSFGFLMDKIVTSGPYAYFRDPQYVGTAIACLGVAIENQSLIGYTLALLLWATFQVSVRFIEEPHMRRIYSKQNKSKYK